MAKFKPFKTLNSEKKYLNTDRASLKTLEKQHNTLFNVNNRYPYLVLHVEFGEERGEESVQCRTVLLLLTVQVGRQHQHHLQAEKRTKVRN